MDVNEVPESVLAGIRDIGRETAARIVADRAAQGPFTRPEDLLIRGVVTAYTLHRIERRLIFIAPAPGQGPSNARPW